jgi:hypothetical protein
MLEIIWSIDETPRKKKQLNEGEIALRHEETARKRKHFSEKKLEEEKVLVCPILMSFSRSNVSYQAEMIN